MTVIVVVMTILTLLALLAVPKVNAQTPVHFEYPLFDETSGNTLIVLNNASIDSSDRVLKLTDTTNNRCADADCPGQIMYSTPIEFIGRNLEKTLSFSSSFVFSLTSLSEARPDGFLFFLTAIKPNDLQTTSFLDWYGVFPFLGQTTKPTIAVEFDTDKDWAINDIDDNHVGVDLNQVESPSQESCNSQNISLLSGNKIKTWIEYHDLVKTLEIRLAYWDPDVVRPAYPLLNTSLDLTTLVEPLMYVGFASRVSYGQLQQCAIYSWSFHSKHESRALSNKSKIIMWSCGGLVLAVIVILAACFCLEPYCHKKSTEAAKAQKCRRKQSEAAGYARDVGEEEDSSREEALVPRAGASDIVIYQNPSSPISFSVGNLAKTSKSWIVWSTGAGTSPNGRPFGHTGPLSSVQIQRAMSWGYGHNTRELQVVRSQVLSSQRSPLYSLRHASPLAGDTIIYTNTLYDSSPEESRGIQPRQRPLFPGSHERRTRAAGWSVRQWVFL